MAGESNQHRLLKARAKEWLYSRGCIVTRTEVPFFNRKVIIDVVGYRNGQPVIGIECGNTRLAGDVHTLQYLPFPVFQLSYLEEPKSWQNKVEAHMGKPHHLIHSRYSPKSMPYTIKEL